MKTDFGTEVFAVLLLQIIEIFIRNAAKPQEAWKQPADCFVQ